MEVKYGKIENGILVTPSINYKNVINAIYSEQILLQNGFKPIVENEISDKRSCVKTYIDHEDHIEVDWILTQIDNHEEINKLKNLLSSSDYKIIKCYEYRLVGNVDPYDIIMIHKERQAIRDQINELESQQYSP